MTNIAIAAAAKMRVSSVADPAAQDDLIGTRTMRLK